VNASCLTSVVPALVLDTNAVLDWLVFRDAGMTSVAAAIEARTLRWIACPSMRAELALTLGRAALARWQPDSERVLASFDRWADMQSAPALSTELRCSDPDDQVFLDLALGGGARWLLSHDRALLRLARRARRFRLEVILPSLWLAP
jgi:uncharacterized protein